MKSILVPLRGLGVDRPPLAMADRIGARFGAHIHGLHVHRSAVAELTRLSYGEAYLDQDVCDAIDGELRAQAAAAEAAFLGYCREAGIPLTSDGTAPLGRVASWRTVEAEPSEEIVLTGRRHELIVMGRPAEPSAHHTAFIGDVVIRTGRPLLLTPPDLPDTTGKRIAIAWKNTRETAHALSAAMPFIAMARSVTIIAVPESAEDCPGEEAQRFANTLTWIDGGIDVRIGIVADSVSQAILDEANANRSDLLVIGGYGHSRARELLLGGVTRDLLHECALPLLVTH